jgi:hypothetical protein
MAELTPEQIAKGYYTDISGINTALDKVQEQEALRAKAKQAQQDKLYQGIKDISGVFDNKYAATGTSADPILLGKINKKKEELIQGLMSGKVSPSSAYMMASSGVADINNLAGTISQYRQNTEKKIADLKKDHPELNSEQLLNDSIKSAIYNPETGEVIAPNSNYDYASTLFNEDRLGRYTDKELLNINNQKAWKDLEGAQGYMKTGPFTYEHKMRPGQMIVPGRGGGMEISFESTPVGFELKENIVNKNGKAVKQQVRVGGLPGANDALISYFEGNRGLKSAAQYEMADLDEIAKSDKEFAKKWDNLNPEDKYRVAALKYAKSNLGSGGSYVKPADLSAEAQYNLRLRELSKGNQEKENKFSGLVDAWNIVRGSAGQAVEAQAPMENLAIGSETNRTPVYDLTNMVSKGTDKNLEDGHGNPIKIYYDKANGRIILNTKKKGDENLESTSRDKSGKPDLESTSLKTQFFEAGNDREALESFGKIAQSVGIPPSQFIKLIQGQ